MTFLEYRDQKAVELLHVLARKRLAVYGTGANAARIISLLNSEEYFVVDEKNKHTYWNNMYVYSFDEVLLMGIDAVIIAAQIDSSEIVYARVVDKVVQNRVKIYDLFGNDYIALHKKILLKQKCLSDYSKENACQSINNHDAVSFQAEGVLFNIIRDDETGITRFILRKGGVALFNQARRKKKQIHIVVSNYIEEKDIKRLLSISEAENQEFLYYSADGKYADLFFEIRQNSKGSVIHFGTSYLEDVLAPEIFGIDSFRLFNSFELFQYSMYDLPEEYFDQTNVKNDYENAIKMSFSDPFVDNLRKNFIDIENNRFWKDLYHSLFKKEKYGVVRDQNKSVLFVNEYVPIIERNTDSKVTYCYLKIFIDLGYNVYMLPRDGQDLENRSAQLEEEGIKVLSGELFSKYWLGWLLLNGDVFDCVFLQRPDVANQYFDAVEYYCVNARVIYYTADLHFLRYQREFMVTGIASLQKLSENYRKMEVSLLKKAQIVYTAGTYEAAYIKELFPEKKVKSIPILTYDSNRIKRPKNMSDRRDILFVGGYEHDPNVDAVEWIAEEILPLIHKQRPDIVCHIVGSHPPAFFRNYQSEHFVIDGYVPEKRLEELYRDCRLALEPLRYGAGVKGKILEAAYYHMPVVTTSIGAEGIEEADQFMVICDDAQEIANAVVDLYNDIELLKTLADGGERVIRRHYTTDAAMRILCEDLGIEKEKG